MKPLTKDDLKNVLMDITGKEKSLVNLNTGARLQVIDLLFESNSRLTATRCLIQTLELWTPYLKEKDVTTVQMFIHSSLKLEEMGTTYLNYLRSYEKFLLEKIAELNLLLGELK